MSNSSIWPMDRTLSGATTPGQSGPGSDGNERVLRIPQSSSIAEASSLDCLVSYPGHSLGDFYPFEEMPSVYSATPADCAGFQEGFVNKSYKHARNVPGEIK